LPFIGYFRHKILFALTNSLSDADEGTWFGKTHFSGALSSIGTENAFETRFQIMQIHLILGVYNGIIHVDHAPTENPALPEVARDRGERAGETVNH